MRVDDIEQAKSLILVEENRGEKDVRKREIDLLGTTASQVAQLESEKELLKKETLHN